MLCFYGISLAFDQGNLSEANKHYENEFCVPVTTIQV